MIFLGVTLLLKVTKKQGFTLSLKDIYLEKTQWGDVKLTSF